MSQLNCVVGTGQNGAVQRRWPRYTIDVRIRAVVHSGKDPKAIHGRCANVSQGGIAAFLPAELAVGETLELNVTLPYCSQPLKIRALVRNRRSFTYGLEFVDIEPAQQAAIKNACRSLELVQ